MQQPLIVVAEPVDEQTDGGYSQKVLASESQIKSKIQDEDSTLKA